MSEKPKKALADIKVGDIIYSNGYRWKVIELRKTVFFTQRKSLWSSSTRSWKLPSQCQALVGLDGPLACCKTTAGSFQRGSRHVWEHAIK